MTKKTTGRPKGRKDSKPRKKKTPKKKAKKKRPAFEEPDVKVTPYPRAGDNPAFEGLLDKMQGQLQEPQPATEPGQEPSTLTGPDVAELVKWPFELWAQSQQLESLRISDAEAQSVAEPLQRILERHNVGRLLPPDALDGIQVAARVTPIMTERWRAIKEERKKRGPERKPGDNPKGRNGHGSPHPAFSQKPEPQGAPLREPTEI